jgi:hypothetical protein
MRSTGISIGCMVSARRSILGSRFLFLISPWWATTRYMGIEPAPAPGDAGQAHLLSGDDEKYVRELIAQWRSWIKANPYPLGSTGEARWRSPSAACRGSGWTSCWRERPSSAEFRSEWRRRSPFTGVISSAIYLLIFLRTHTCWEKRLRCSFSAPCIRKCRGGSLEESGWRIVLHEAQRQVRPDGVYFEQSLYYHVYALDFFLYARLARGSEWNGNSTGV